MAADVMPTQARSVRDDASMRSRAPILTIALAGAVASCGGGTQPHTARPSTATVVVHTVKDTAATRLERALLTNPNNEATWARSRSATAADRASAVASFGGHPRRLFT